MDFSGELQVKYAGIVHMKFDCLFIAVPLSSEILKQNMDIYTEIDRGWVGTWKKDRSDSILYLRSCLPSILCNLAIFEEDVENC